MPAPRFKDRGTSGGREVPKKKEGDQGLSGGDRGYQGLWEVKFVEREYKGKKSYTLCEGEGNRDAAMPALEM